MCTTIKYIPYRMDSSSCESGMPIYNYYWEGTQVSSQEEYMDLLNQVYNTEQAITPYDGAQYEGGRYVGNGLCDYNEIIETINNY